MVSDKVISCNKDVLVTDLEQMIAAQRLGFTFVFKFFSLDPDWWKNTKEWYTGHNPHAIVFGC